MSLLFPVYSIGKPFLAQAVLELGLPLDSVVGDHLADLDEAYASRRIGELLNHTSGLNEYAALKDYHQAVSYGLPAWSREELLGRCLALSHNIAGFQYSNIGYLLLRMVVEAKTGLSVFDAIKKLVLDPLEIEGFAEWESASEIVPGYDPRWVYSGTFLASREAIEQGFLRLMQHREATIGLSAGLCDLPYQGTGFDHPSYGFGLMVDRGSDAGQPKFVGHGGGGPGFAHMILVNPLNWRVAMKSSTSDFDQSAAITELRAELAY